MVTACVYLLLSYLFGFVFDNVMKICIQLDLLALNPFKLFIGIKHCQITICLEFSSVCIFYYVIDFM